MNTKKLIFGILACLTLMASTAAPYVTLDDNQELGIDKRKLKKTSNN